MLMRADSRFRVRDPRQFADLCLGQVGFDQRSLNLVNSSSILARTVIAQVVPVDAVDDVRDSALSADFFEPVE